MDNGEVIFPLILLFLGLFCLCFNTICLRFAPRYQREQLLLEQARRIPIRLPV